MSVPPVPPRPYSAQAANRPQQNAPPLPPLPPDIRLSLHESPPHFDDPLAAPRPHRLDPSIPANMALKLDEQIYQQGINYNPGFTIPQPTRGVTPLPPPQGADWSPWLTADPYASLPQARQRTYSSPQPPQPMSLNRFPTPSLGLDLGTQQQMPHSGYPSTPKSPSPPRSPGELSLTAPLPQASTLQASIQDIQNPNYDPALKIAWVRDVLFLVEKHIQVNTGSSSTDPTVGPVVITDPQLQWLVQVAVPTVLQLAGTAGPGSAQPPFVAEALYWRATFAASGAYPEFVQHNPRMGFRDFESAARGGYAAAWFRLGREYENFNDVTHAKECFERGVKHGVENCIYRMGMAHLLGQLGLPATPAVALPLLQRAATLATPQAPQPAYIYAQILLSEFPSPPSAPLPTTLIQPLIPQGSTQLLEARRHMERAAYLGFAPAQYKLGHAYEFAQPPFVFDPLLSVQYYSLASQQGELEAHMALSKWFLCGSGPVPGGEDAGFEKDEALALTFAEKAASRGLPSAEFAMGYYAEVGVGGVKDLQAAMAWYNKAREHGNTDAAERLAALSQPAPTVISRDEHNNLTENKLVRKRTLAKERSDTEQQQQGGTANVNTSNGLSYSSPNQQPSQTRVPQGLPASSHPNVRHPQDGRRVVETIRRNSLMQGQGPSQYPHPQANVRPQQQQQYASPDMNRYTLTDSSVPNPAGRGGGGRKSPGPGTGRPAGRGRGGRVASHTAAGPQVEEEHHEGLAPGTTIGVGGGLVMPAKPGKGPATFAEMGFQGAKAEDKDCVIM